MKKAYLLLIVLLILTGSTLFAQYIQVTFRDVTNPNQTKALILQQNPSYPIGSTVPPANERWLIQLYKDGGDNVIDTLNAEGLPAGDDIVCPNEPTTMNTTQGLYFAAVNTWLMNAIRFYPAGSTGVAHQGEKVYLRIFNAPTLGAATKYIQFTNLYTVPSTNATVNIVTSGYAWTTWKDKGTTPIISGTISSALSVSGVSVACTGQPTVLTGATGTYSFTVPTGSTVTVTPTKAGYFFTPASITYTDVMAAIIDANFTMTKSAPNVAVNPVPANSATNINPYIGQVSWEYVLAAGYSAPEGFRVYFPETAAPVWVPYTGNGTYHFNIPLLNYSTLYSWKVVPTNTLTKGMVEEARSASKDEAKGDADGIISWAFTTRGGQLITPGITETVDPDGAGPLGAFQFNTPSTEVVPTTPVIEYTVVPLTSVPFFWGLNFVNNAFAMNLSTNLVTDHAQLSITVPAGTWYGIVYYGGVWHQASPYPVTGPGTMSWPDIPFSSYVQLVLSGGYDPTLPVELSTFAAQYTTTPSGSFFVELTWVVQSETNHMGYYILRNTSDALNTAISLNPSEPITNGNTSGTQISYAFRDVEIDHNTTYYYWLESADLDGTNHFFCPITVVVGGTPQEPTPLVPTITALLDAYPNPFGLNTTIPYTLKAAGDVKIDIYNVKGQVVWSSNVHQEKAGFFTVPWQGQDMNGKAVSSGIYYYRMTSGKYTASKKIVLVK